MTHLDGQALIRLDIRLDIAFTRHASLRRVPDYPEIWVEAEKARCYVGV